MNSILSTVCSGGPGSSGKHTGGGVDQVVNTGGGFERGL